jgi:PTS system mannose-specific IID component
MASMLGASLFVRSLFVQSSWSFSGMQSPGFFFMTWPALARRRLSDAGRVAAGVRALGHFNTHPYFAGLVAAVVIREEERGAPAEAVDGLKQSLMCALGAVGDEFFWATLRPFAAVAALPAALAGRAWAPLILLAVYNVPHLAVRGWGIGAGLSRGRGVVELLQRRPLSRTLPALGFATVFVAGALLGGAACDRRWGLLPGDLPVSVAASAAVFALLLVILGRGQSQGRLLAGLAAAAAVAGAVRAVGAP